jgi:hypothetical protein
MRSLERAPGRPVAAPPLASTARRGGLHLARVQRATDVQPLPRARHFQPWCAGDDRTVRCRAAGRRRFRGRGLGGGLAGPRRRRVLQFEPLPVPCHRSLTAGSTRIEVAERAPQFQDSIVTGRQCSIRIRFLVRCDTGTNCYWLEPNRWRRRESNPRLDSSRTCPHTSASVNARLRGRCGLRTPGRRSLRLASNPSESADVVPGVSRPVPVNQFFPRRRSSPAAGWLVHRNVRPRRWSKD